MSSIFFNGRTTSIPGAYVEVNAAALAAVGISAVGVVALVGEARGGSPYNGATPVHSISNPGSVARTFKSGDLVEAAAIAFDPALDIAIPGGANELRLVKVNPATQSTLTLLDGSANPSLVITSKDYGVDTTQISVDVSAGTTSGTLYTITRGETVETFDNVGLTSIFDVLFTQGTNAMTTVTLEVSPTVGVTGRWTRASVGLDGDFSASVTSGSTARVASANAADTTQTATIYGLDTNGAPQTEVISLNGITVVAGTATWSAVLGVILSAVTAGNITVSDSAGTLATITAGTLTIGVVEIDNGEIQKGAQLGVTATAAPAPAANLILFGFDGQTPTGQVISVDATSETVTAALTEITVIVLGALAAAETFTVSAIAFILDPVNYARVSDVDQRIDDFVGWSSTVTAASNGVSPGDVLISDLDTLAATDVTSTVQVTGNLALSVAAINQSGLVTAARASGGTAVPANTATPVYLAGGIEGATSFADWQAALNLLRAETVNTVVVLSSDAAVQAALLAHARFMAGEGRGERDVVLGTAALANRATVIGGAIPFNSRHARLCFQSIDRFNTEGVLETFPPIFLAAMVAGAQAGAPIAEPLTNKLFNVRAVRQASDIVLVDDSNALINAGIWILETVPNVGFRCLRNVTTYLADDNLAFVEASANQATDTTVLRVREAVQTAIGRKGFQPTVNRVGGVIIDTLNTLIDDEVISLWQNLILTLASDVLEVDVQVAPILPINFAPTTINLVPASFAATL